MRIRIPYCFLLLGPSLMFAIGFLCNAIVMAANHGSMPVLVPGGCFADTMGEDLIHSCMTASSHFTFLADWIVVRHYGVFSLGDFLEGVFHETFWPSLVLWIGLIIDHLNKD